MIKPDVLKGFRDFLPEMMIPKKELIRRLERTFESFSFAPIDTPALEYTKILLGKGGGETDKQIFRFEDNGGRDVAMRFDLTVPLARFIAANYSNLTFPFKRYHIGPVWRGENVQKGRYREFYQCDFDIIGSQSELADFEILLLIKEGFDAIDCGSYRINVNHRKLLNAVLETMGIADKLPEVLRNIDKIYKIGVENVKKELGKIGLDRALADKLLKALNLDGDTKSMGIIGEDIFSALASFKEIINEEHYGVVEEMENIFNSFKKLGILDCYAFNPAITRGLDYYTGIVFESFITDRLDFGSVCSGGRYDNLGSVYSKNGFTGVGGSFGLDRLMAVLEDKGLIDGKKSVAELLIFNMDGAKMAEYYELAAKLRAEGINTEIVLEQQKINKQFKAAQRKGIKYVLIAGDEELTAGKYNLKDIEAGEEQKAIDLEQIISIVKG